MPSNAHFFNVERLLNAAREYLKEVGPLGVLPLLWPYYVAEDVVVITYLTPRTEAGVRLLVEMGESVEALEEPARAYIWRPSRETLQAAKEFDECMRKVYEEGTLLAASEGYRPDVPEHCLKYDLLIMEAAGLVAAEDESLTRRIFT